MPGRAVAGESAGASKDFDILINLTSPFVYDNSLGNLLLDVRNFSGSQLPTFDAVFDTGDAVSRLVSTNVSSPTGGASTFGLVTQIEFQPVPEPGTLSLLGLGLGALALRRRKRQ